MKLSGLLIILATTCADDPAPILDAGVDVTDSGADSDSTVALDASTSDAYLDGGDTIVHPRDSGSESDSGTRRFPGGSGADLRNYCYGHCGAIFDGDTRNYCYGHCGAIFDGDLRNYCYGHCGAIFDGDLRNYCYGHCGAIFDGDLRNHCYGHCGAIFDNGLRNECYGHCGAIF